MPGLQRGHQEAHEGEEADAGGRRQGFDGREREGHYGGGTGGSDGAAARSCGRRGIKFYLQNKAKDKWKENPDRLELEKKRVANDTKRTKLAEQAASGGVSGKTIEEILEEAESGGADAEV